MDPRLREHVQREQGEDRRREVLEAQRRVADGERPWERAQGPDSAVEAVRDFRFPTTMDELVGALGDRQVRLEDGRQVDLREVLHALGNDRSYLSLAEFQAAVERHWGDLDSRRQG